MPFFDVSTFDDNDANIEEGMKFRFLVKCYLIIVKEMLIIDEKNIHSIEVSGFVKEMYI